MEEINHTNIVEIAKNIATDVDWHRVNFKEDLTEQGVDSLDMINIIFAFQDTYGVEISDDSIAEGEWLTLDKMVVSLNKSLQAKADQ
jgi:acyl carrier protein